MRYVTKSVQETEALGKQIALSLKPGTVLAFTGDLGAGKTAFIRGVAAGLSVTDRVTSPTFTIANEYLSGKLPLFHFDLYRLSSEDDLYDIGWYDYLDRNGICVVEWSEKLPEMFSDCPHISIERSPCCEDERIIYVEGL